MGFRDNFKELSDFMNHKRRETTLRGRMIKKSIKSENDQVEYYNFKNVIYQKIDELLYSGDYSRVILKPKSGKESYFNKIVDDEDFTRFYEGRITAGGELEVTIKKIE